MWVRSGTVNTSNTTGDQVLIPSSALPAAPTAVLLMTTGAPDGQSATSWSKSYAWINSTVATSYTWCSRDDSPDGFRSRYVTASPSGSGAGVQVLQGVSGSGSYVVDGGAYISGSEVRVNYSTVDGSNNYPVMWIAFGNCSFFHLNTRSANTEFITTWQPELMWIVLMGTNNTTGTILTGVEGGVGISTRLEAGFRRTFGIVGGLKGYRQFAAGAFVGTSSFFDGLSNPTFDSDRVTLNQTWDPFFDGDVVIIGDFGGQELHGAEHIKGIGAAPANENLPDPDFTPHTLFNFTVSTEILQGTSVREDDVNESWGYANATEQRCYFLQTLLSGGPDNGSRHFTNRHLVWSDDATDDNPTAESNLTDIADVSGPAITLDPNDANEFRSIIIQVESETIVSDIEGNRIESTENVPVHDVSGTILGNRIESVESVPVAQVLGNILGNRIESTENVPIHEILGTILGQRIESTESVPVHIVSGTILGQRIEPTAVLPVQTVQEDQEDTIQGNLIASTESVPVHIVSGTVLGNRIESTAVLPIQTIFGELLGELIVSTESVPAHIVAGNILANRIESTENIPVHTVFEDDADVINGQFILPTTVVEQASIAGSILGEHVAPTSLVLPGSVIGNILANRIEPTATFPLHDIIRSISAELIASTENVPSHVIVGTILAERISSTEIVIRGVILGEDTGISRPVSSFRVLETPAIMRIMGGTTYPRKFS